MSNFAERLKILMNENEHNPYSLSVLLGISSSVVNNWLRPDCDPTLTNLIRLADLYDCSIEYLVGRSDDDTRCGFKPAPEFAVQLAKVIADSEKSIYSVCKQAKISWTTFNSWRHGTIPKLSSLLPVSKAYGITIDALVGRE